MVVDKQRSKISTVLGNRNYLLLWSGQLISSIGSSFNSISLYFLLLKTSGDDGFLPLFGLFLVNALVYLFLAPITGALVDSLNRRSTMVWADVLRALLVLLIPLTTTLWQIYFISALVTLGTLLFDPARNSLLPRVLESKKELLFVGNSFMTTSTSIAETIGFFAGGVFTVAFGFTAAFYFDAASFLVSALCVLLLRVSEPPQEVGVQVIQAARNFAVKVKEGLKLVWSLDKLRSFFSYYLLFALAFGAGNFLFPILIEEGYRLDADAFGYFSGSMTLGYLLGSFLIGPVGERFNRFRLLTTAVLIIGLCTISLGLVGSLGPAVVWAFLIGVLNPVTLVFSRVFIQEEVAEEQLGRVFSLLTLVMQVGMLGSLGLSFLLLQYMPIRTVMLALGLLTLLVAIIGPGLTKLSRFMDKGGAQGTELPLSG